MGARGAWQVWDESHLEEGCYPVQLNLVPNFAPGSALSDFTTGFFRRRVNIATTVLGTERETGLRDTEPNAILLRVVYKW